jgi:hypothetical protein
LREAHPPPARHTTKEPPLVVAEKSHLIDYFNRYHRFAIEEFHRICEIPEEKARVFSAIFLDCGSFIPMFHNSDAILGLFWDEDLNHQDELIGWIETFKKRIPLKRTPHFFDPASEDLSPASVSGRQPAQEQQGQGQELMSMRLTPHRC